MSKLNFLGLCVVIQQHTPLDVVEVYLKKQEQPYFPFQEEGWTYELPLHPRFKIQKAFTFYKSSEVSSEDYTVIMPMRL